MRRFTILATLAAVVLAAAPDLSAAQQRRGGGDDQQSRKEQAKKKKEKEAWQAPRARLPGERNAGPCPYVKVLYDAGRYVEFQGGQESAGQVAWTGEIQGVEADCRYREAEPIQIDMDVLFNFGRGPQAKGQNKTYRYWVAVTERNRSVLAKEWFDIPAEFTPGQDRVAYRERVGGITIPRKDIHVTGAAFEVLVGFEVTPEMAAFNRDGKRFRVDAGAGQGGRQASTK